MSVIRSAWKFVLVLLLLFSLALNVAMFVGGSLYSMASSAFGALTGIRTVAAQHASEVAELGSDLANERKAGRELRGEVVDLSDKLVSERRVAANLKGEVAELTGDLAAERTARRKLTSEVAEISGDLATERVTSKKARSQLSDATENLVSYRGRKMAASEAAEITADRISKRAVKTSIRSIGSMAGEALPYIGAAVIVGVTAMELKDLCDTLKDMTELRRAYNPELNASEDETTVCSMKVPSSGELWEMTKASPGQAWAAAKEVTPTLEDIQNYEFPDIDWNGAWNATSEGAGSAWSAIMSGASTAMDATAETTGGWMDSAKEYWSGEEGTDAAKEQKGGQ